MSAKLKRDLIAVEIDCDELAARIGAAAMGVKPPAGTSATQMLDQLNAMTEPDVPPMGDGFRKAAVAAMRYFHDCINSGMRGQ